MATHLGHVEPSFSAEPVGLFNAFERPPEDPGVLLLDPELRGILDPRAPMVVRGSRNELLGHVETFFGGVWFNTIHILPSSNVDLGAVTDGQTTEFEVWNAYDIPNDLTNILDQESDGVAITPQDDSLPTEFRPLESRTYLITVTPSNSFDVTGLFTFQFATSNIELVVTGLRSILWSYAPDWSKGIKERYKWNTEVLESDNGQEQRILWRGEPDRFIDYSIVVTDHQLRQMNSYLFAWQDKYYAIPYWPDYFVLPEDLPAGSTVITFDTTQGRLYAKGDVLAVYLSAERVHTYTISDVDYNLGVGTVTLSSATGQLYYKNTAIIPIVPATIAKEVKARRLHGNLTRVTTTFKVYAPGQHFLPWEYTLYQDADLYHSITHDRDLPVMTLEPNRAQTHVDTYKRSMYTIDAGTTQPWFRDKSRRARVDMTYSWMLQDRARITRLLMWTVLSNGSLLPSWTPTWGPDLILAQDLPTGSTDLHTVDTLFRTTYAFQRQKLNIRIEMIDGTVWYRRLTGIYVSEEGHEVFPMDEPILEQTLVVNQVRRISFMSLSRIANDVLDIHWHTPDVMEAKVSMRSVEE